MATVRFILQADNRKAHEGRYPVYLRVSDRGKREYFSTGFFANHNEFEEKDDDGKAIGRYRQGSGVKKFTVIRREVDGLKEYDNKSANSILSIMEAEVSEIIKQLESERKDWTVNDVRNRYTIKRSSKTLFSFAEAEIIERQKKEGKFQNAEITRNALRSFKNYDPKFEGKAFSEIDKDYLDGFIKHCLSKGNKENTIGIHLREIRKIWNLAIEKGICAPGNYPFGKGGVKIPKNETRKRFIPLDGIRLIASTNFADPKIETAKHLFMFSFFCRGMNWKDMANLKRSSISERTLKDGKTVDVLSYKRAKTHKDFEIQITDKIQKELKWFKENTELFSNYLLPIFKCEPVDSNRDEYLNKARKEFNKRMKTIARELNLPISQADISAYWARHSFAMGLLKTGRSKEVIGQALGHSNLSTTEIYLAGFSTEEMAELTDIQL